VKRVGFVVHPGRELAVWAADRLSGWLEERGVETRRFAEDPDHGADAALAFAMDLDLIVSVGGDGTFLRAAYLSHTVACPILGVKVGRLGFLTEVEPEHAPAILQRFLDGTASIEERLAVVAEASGAASFEPQWALNEMMVEKRARHRIIRLAVYVDDAYVTTFSADGVIVATPTGSTAYSFSAGGPIVSPTIPCILVTPVAAHMVFDRSLVLSADEHVVLEVVGEEDGLLSADGRESFELPVGAAVRIGRAPTSARLVRPDDVPDFHALVREKFDLPGDDPGTRHGPPA
jgi:NAD+ kinase